MVMSGNEEKNARWQREFERNSKGKDRIMGNGYMVAPPPAVSLAASASTVLAFSAAVGHHHHHLRRPLIKTTLDSSAGYHPDQPLAALDNSNRMNEPPPQLPPPPSSSCPAEWMDCLYVPLSKGVPQRSPLNSLNFVDLLSNRNPHIRKGLRIRLIR